MNEIILIEIGAERSLKGHLKNIQIFDLRSSKTSYFYSFEVFDIILEFLGQNQCTPREGEPRSAPWAVLIIGMPLPTRKIML